MKEAQNPVRIRIPHPFWLLGLALALIVIATALGIGIPAYRQHVTTKKLDEAKIHFTTRELAPDWAVTSAEWLFDESFELLPEIYEVDGSWTKMSDEKLELLRGLSGIEELHLSDGKFTDNGLRSLTGLRRLRLLIVSNPGITDAGLRPLKTLRSLRNLNLMHTQVTDEGLRDLAELDQLEYLGLCDTQVTEAGLHHLSRLSNLRAIALDGTPVFKELSAALERGDSEWLKAAIARTPVLRLPIGEYGETLLHLAVEQDTLCSNVVQTLLAAGLPLNKKPGFDRSVAEYLEGQRGYRGDSEVDSRLRFLLKSGSEYTLPIAIGLADTDRIRTLSQIPLPIEKQQEFLEDAMRKGRHQVVKVLLDEWMLDPNRSRLEGVPLLSDAPGQPEVIRVLIEAGAVVDARCKYLGSGMGNTDNCTTLHLAAREGALKSVEILIAHGATVDIQNDEGSTPLMEAALFGRPDIVALLLHHGADPATTNRKGETALSIARKRLEESPTRDRMRVLDILETQGKGETVKEK